MAEIKFEAMNILSIYDIPYGPFLAATELAGKESLCASGSVVEVDHPV